MISNTRVCNNCKTTWRSSDYASDEDSDTCPICDYYHDYHWLEDEDDNTTETRYASNKTLQTVEDNYNIENQYYNNTREE